MFPNVAYFIAPIALLLLAVVAVFFWDRKTEGEVSEDAGNTKPEGAFRSIFHQLWVLVFWSGLIFFVPLWITFSGKISGLPLQERYIFLGKILLFPLLILSLLRYGYQKGYLKWIQDLQWPDRENK